MIITRTPYRISFVGGGSDLPAFYTREPGAVLSTTINRYLYLCSQAMFKDKGYHLQYEETEKVTGVTRIRHPIFRECLRLFSFDYGLRIATMPELPHGTGMGSSSALAVGLLHNLSLHKGITPTKEELSGQACTIEIEKEQAPVGKQDQYSCAYGGLNVIRFFPDNRVHVEALCINPEVLNRLERNLFLHYIGHPRTAASILNEQRENMKHYRQQETVKKMVRLVDVFRQILENGDLEACGEIIHENWLLKKSLASKISNPHIDAVYAKARAAGATGGKVLGAGAGGFLLCYCPEEQHEKFLAALREFPVFPVQFENQGSQLVCEGTGR